ncbi:thiamine pyrophosphokinase [Podospora appendiculata]|uniref:Thiamine pyrophosphokinase n=1 Tax=Podospora appendiculata TaxID=314037 RepID=A0AAE0X9X6_9PEZI|nr:thiamine pyrophosphokinase [Podospora appendiculata]
MQSDATRQDLPVFKWQPIALVRPPQDADRAAEAAAATPAAAGFALVILNQPLTHLGVTRRLWNNASLRIAADGGANCLYDAAAQHGHNWFDDLALIIGDLDSLRPSVRAYFETRSTRVVHDPDQYSTDFGKAVQHIRSGSSAGAVDIVALGGLGGRVDQGLSQLHHLFLFQADAAYAAGRMYLFSGESLTFLLKAGRHRIRVREEGEEDVFGKYVGILPVREPSVITTRGLEWDVQDWETEFGGQVSTSNHVLPETRVVEVETSRDVLFTIALKDA